MADTSAGWSLFLVVVALLLCAAAFISGMRFQQRRRAEGLDEARDDDGEVISTGAGRLALLESTPVDNGRKLVLVRCDNVEHLIMVGGAADMLIDNDVRKVRTPVQAAASPGQPQRAGGQGAAGRPGGQAGAGRPGGPGAAAAAKPGAPAAAKPAALADSPAAPVRPAAAAASAEASAAKPASEPDQPSNEATQAVEPAGRPVQAPVLTPVPARAGNGSAGAGRIPAEPVTGPAAAPLSGVPLPAAPRPPARRTFFGAAFGGKRDSVRAQDSSGSGAGEPRTGTDALPESRLAGPAAEAPPATRQPLAAVPVVTVEGPRPNTPSPTGSPPPSVAAPAAARPGNVEDFAARREEVPRARGEAVQGRSNPPRSEPVPEPRGAAPAPPLPQAARGEANPLVGQPAAPQAQAVQPAPASAAAGLSNAAGARLNGLPAAGTPWEGGSGLEDEIGRALRSEAAPPVRSEPSAQSNRSEAPVPSVRGSGETITGPAAPPRKSVTDPGTTLGDLAERLESALAREIAAAQQGPGKPAAREADHVDLTLDEFAFDSDAQERRPAEEPAVAAVNPARMPAEPEPRRERQEDAPVISLNSRRRDPVDPLEDEMARLLGELTGDTSRR